MPSGNINLEKMLVIFQASPYGLPQTNMSKLKNTHKNESEAYELLFLARKALEKASRLAVDDSNIETIAYKALKCIPVTNVEIKPPKGKYPKRSDWPLVMIDYLSNLPDFDGDMDYDRGQIAIQAGYLQSGIGAKGFEGDLFIDDNGRCFIITASCRFDGDDQPWMGEWDDEYEKYTPEYKTRNGVDTSSTWYDDSTIRRTTKDCPRINLWTRKTAERHQLESKIYQTGISKFDQFFIMAGAAEQLTKILTNKTTTIE